MRRKEKHNTNEYQFIEGFDEETGKKWKRRETYKPDPLCDIPK